MNERSMVTVYTSSGEKIYGIYIGTPEDFQRTFQQFKMHPKSKDFGINLKNEKGGFIRIPVDIINTSLISVTPMKEDVESEKKEPDC